MSEYQWKDVSVVGFDELMEALERADRKGYIPDAVKEAWEGFNWKPVQQQEPVAWDNCRSEKQCRSWCGNSACASHWNDTSPPANANAGKPWVGLTDEEKSDLWCESTGRDCVNEDTHVFADAIEAKLREKNA